MNQTNRSSPASGKTPRRRTVLLYNPHAVFYTMPLALVAIGSHLDPERYRVVIVDGRLSGDPIAELARHLDDAVCVGMTVLTGGPIRDAVTVSRALKERRPDLPIIWGGWHPSMFGRECLDEPAIDITVQGQGEETFAAVIECLTSAGDLGSVAGICHRTDDGSIVRNPPRPFVDNDNFRSHDYSMIEIEPYFEKKGERQLDYISSQGCPFRCAFCADPFVYGRKWSGLDPERVGREVESLWRRYNFDDLSFQDETFFVYPQRVEAIADELIGRRIDISWAATLRADQASRLGEDLFAKCCKSGLRRALIGVESGSQAMMDRIKKDIKLEQVFEAADLAKRHDIAVIFPFIVGFPDEDQDSVQASLDVAKRLRAMSPEFHTPFFYFKPYPGSAITAEAVARGYKLPTTLEEWAEFDFIGSAGPWVSDAMRSRVERFKFYQQMAWNRVPLWQKPVQQIARWRLARDAYAFPLEKIVGRWLRPATELS